MDKTYKYIEVYQDIKTKIACNEYVIGQKIPSGSELAIRYGCSNLTVKKGLDMLVKEGVLRRRSGFGTEVLRKPIRFNELKDIIELKIKNGGNIEGAQAVGKDIATKAKTAKNKNDQTGRDCPKNDQSTTAHSPEPLKT